METKKIYLCEICKNMFGVIHDSGVVPVCCGQDMTHVKPGTVDASLEKHVPVIERQGTTVTVKVGSVSHPMVPEHYIQWVLIGQNNKFQRVELTPGDKPEAVFVVDSATDPVVALEYCNLHSLWQAEG